MVDEANAREEVGADRQFESDSKGDQESRCEDQVLGDADRGLHVERLIAREEKGKRGREDYLVAKHGAEKEKKSSKGDEEPSVTFFMLVESGRDKLPTLPQEQRPGEDERGKKSYLDLGEKGLGHGRADQNKTGDLKTPQRRRQHVENFFNNRKADAKGQQKSQQRFDKPRPQFRQVAG